MTTVSDLGERALIERITSRLASPPWVVVGPGDDAAVIEPQRGTLEVLTTDAQVEGIHFDRRFCPPDAIGHKALAVNLSDLAAMGASPRAALLSLVLPDALPAAELEAILDGVLALAARHKVALVGGNIARSAAPGARAGQGPLVIDITAIGSVGRRQVLTRAGARPGDELYVTGAIGGGAVGLHALRENRTTAPASAERYLRPEPRVRAGLLLGRTRAASACIDLSDGLADAVQRIAESSGVGVALDPDALPISDEVRRWHGEHGADLHTAALAGGDDYELVFAVRPAHRGRLRQVRRLLGDLPITRIGVATRERAVVLRDGGGAVRAVPAGFEHFRPSVGG